MLEFCQVLFSLMLAGIVVVAVIARSRRRKTREHLEYLAHQPAPQELESSEWVPYDRYN